MKKVKNKRMKQLKGMTLVEVLIALAIFTIMSALVASSVALVCQISRKSSRINDKISVEVKAAEMNDRSSSASDKTLEKGSFKISAGGKEVTAYYDQYKVKDSLGYDDIPDFKFLKPTENK